MKIFLRWMVVLGAAVAFQLPAQTFSGKVVDDQGNPVAGAEVDCYSYSSPNAVLAGENGTVTHTTTDSQGAFTSSSIDSSVLVAKKAGMATAWRSQILGRNVSSDSLVMGAPSSLGGIVVDENGRPVEGAEVWVLAAVGKGAGALVATGLLLGRAAHDTFSTQTGPDGHFRIENFPSDAQAELSVTKKGKTLPDAGSDLANLNGGELRYHAGQQDIRLALVPAGGIDGKLIVDGTEQGLSGVKLALRSATQGILGNIASGTEPIRTGTDGAFQISDVAPGSYKIEAMFEGKPVAEWVAVSDPVTVVSGETLHDVKVRASKGGVAVITAISKADQKPVTNLIVVAYDQADQTQKSATTGDNGVAMLRLRPGQWVVVANKRGWSSEQNNISVEEGQTNRVEIDLTPPLSIQGTVRGPSGETIAGATVSIGPNYSGQADTKTDANGHYQISWSMPDYGNGANSFSIMARSEEKKLAVTHDIDETITNLDLKMQPALEMSVKVEDADGKPITNATATLMRFTGNTGFPINLRDARADDQGRIRMESLPQGEQYSVNIAAKGYGSANQTVAATDTQTTHYDVPTVALPLANLKLAGRVVGPDGKPAPGLRVQLNGEGQPNDFATSDATGHFLFDSVCPGPLQVYGNAANLFGNVQTVGGDTNVVLRLQNNNVVNQNNAPQFKITGVLTDSSGAPVSGVRLAVYPNFWGNSQARTDMKGHYSMIVQNADTLFQQAGNMNTTPTIVARSLDRDLAVTHEFSERTTNLDLQLQDGMTISAKVQDAGGKPIKNALATLMFFTGQNSFQMNDGDPAKADDQGRIQITAVPQGQQYNVNVSASGYGSASQQLDATATKTTAFECRPFVLRLADRKLAGHVLGLDGKPVAGAQLQISGEGQPSGNTRSDLKGHFSFPAVCAGPIQVFAYKQPNGNGGQFLQTSVQAQGGDTNLTLRFTGNNTGGGGTVVQTEGTVFGPDGAPVAGVSLGVMTQFGGNTANITSDADGKYSIAWQFQQINNGGRNQFKNMLVARDEAHDLAGVEDVDEKTTSKDVHLQQGLKLTGNVQEPSGAALPSAQIQLDIGNGNNYVMLGQQMLPVDNHGSFSIGALPQGKDYLLFVTCPGHGSAQKNLRSGETQTASIDLSTIVLKVADRELAGQVVDADNKPVSGAQVQINGNGQPNGNVRSDADGHFYFSQVCEGSVQVMAYKQPSGTGQFLQGDVQAQGGDTNVVVKLGVQNVNRGRAGVVARARPLIPPPWGWATISQWPNQHRKVVIVLLGAQMATLAGTAGAILWITRKRRA